MTHFESKPADAFGFKEVLYEKGDWVARITINRPHNYNAYSTPALEELATAFRDAAFDDSISVIVYTGAGHQAFCTGGDVKEYEKLYTQRPRDYWKYMRLFRAYIESILNSGKPVVARLNGMAVGGGNESQMACDLAVMAEHALCIGEEGLEGLLVSLMHRHGDALATAGGAQGDVVRARGLARRPCVGHRRARRAALRGEDDPRARPRGGHGSPLRRPRRGDRGGRGRAPCRDVDRA